MDENEELAKFGSNIRSLLLCFKNGASADELVRGFLDVTGENALELLEEFDYAGLDDQNFLDDFYELIRFENGVFKGIPLEVQLLQVGLIRTTRNRKLDKFGRRRRRKRVFGKPRFSKFFETDSADCENFNFHARRKWSPDCAKAANSCEVFSLSTIYDGSAQNGVKLLQLQKNKKIFINLWLIGGDENLFLSKIALQNVVSGKEEFEIVEKQIEKWTAERKLALVKSPPVVPKPIYKNEIDLVKLETFCELFLEENFNSDAGTPLIRINRFVRYKLLCEKRQKIQKEKRDFRC